MKENIPVVDVTEVQPTKAEAMAAGIARAQELLGSGNEFVMLSFDDKDGVSVAAGCEDFRILQAMMVLLTMIGHEALGEQALANLPPAVAQATAVATGFSKLSQMIRAEATAAGKQLN